MVDLLVEIRRQLALVDPESRRTRAEELITALIDAGCGGDVKAIQEVLNRIHGRIEPRMAVAKFEEHIQTRMTAALLDQTERTERTERIDLGVDLLCASDPAITRPMAERYMSELIPLLEVQRRNVALIRGANPLAPLAKSPPEMEEELIRRTWRELGMPGDPDLLCRLDEPGDRKHKSPPPPKPEPQPAPDRPPPPMIRPRLEPPIEPDPSPLPVKPGVWVDMGGELFISIPEEP